MFKYKRNQIIVLNNIFVHPVTLDFVNVGVIRKVKYRFNIFKETEYLIHLSDGILECNVTHYSSWSRWFKESEIKRIKD